jgi:hypothetical protein
MRNQPLRNRRGFAELATINYNSVLKENEGAPEISASLNSIFNHQ